MFLQELRAVNDNYKLGYDIYYWRTSNQIEVDFILYGKKGLFAFEIKRKSKYSDKDLRGLKKFLKDFPIARGFFIYGGKKRFYEKNIEIIPVDEAIAKLHDILDQ